jgi:glycosyltransferase involved in cell wall biosynthesis
VKVKQSYGGVFLQQLFDRGLHALEQEGLELSVIVPVYNSERSLSKCVRSFCEADFPEEKYEVVIVDDGSTDNSYKIARGLKDTFAATIKICEQSHRGPAAARNAGIKNAVGRIVLFTGADCVATRELLQRHVTGHAVHKDESIAILGYTTWHPRLRITPFMRWLEKGMQSDYGRLHHGERVDSTYFNTTNISLKRRFMLRNGLFDEAFPYAAFEDIELGYRLKGAGLKIIYDQTAVVYHLHRTDPLSYSHRQRMVGRSIVLLKRKHPEMPLDMERMRRYGTVPEWVLLFPTRIVYLLDRLNIALPALLYSIPMNYYCSLEIRQASRTHCEIDRKPQSLQSQRRQNRPNA